MSREPDVADGRRPDAATRGRRERRPDRRESVELRRVISGRVAAGYAGDRLVQWRHHHGDGRSGADVAVGLER